MTEQNKKNSRLQLNEGTISVDAESIVFKPQAFKACDEKTDFTTVPGSTVVGNGAIKRIEDRNDE